LVANILFLPAKIPRDLPRALWYPYCAFTRPVTQGANVFPFYREVWRFVSGAQIHVCLISVVVVIFAKEGFQKISRGVGFNGHGGYLARNRRVDILSARGIRMLRRGGHLNSKKMKLG
jgi:hypothetical protein